MLKQIKSMVIVIVGVFVGLVLLAFLLAMASPRYSYHYNGKTSITPEQYAEIATGKSDGTSSLVKNDSGLLFTYDFYSSAAYSFLIFRSTTGVLDNAEMHALLLTLNGSSGSLLIVLAIGIVLVVVAYQYQRKIASSLKGLYVGYLRFKYRNLNRLGKQSNIVNISDIVVDCPGIIAVRSWRCSPKGVLTSLVHNISWKETALTADSLPTKANFSGVYAYCLGAPMLQSGEILGLVEMRGKYEYHPDGVVRAENCNILCLFLHNASNKLSQHLGVKYSVPVCVASSAKEAYTSWLFSKRGLQSMQHNISLIGE